MPKGFEGGYAIVTSWSQSPPQIQPMTIKRDNPVFGSPGRSRLYDVFLAMPMTVFLAIGLSRHSASTNDQTFTGWGPSANGRMPWVISFAYVVLGYYTVRVAARLKQ